MTRGARRPAAAHRRASRSRSRSRIQIYTSLVATAATAVLAPEIARDLGLPPALVGVFVGLVYVGAMSGASRRATFIARHGAIRVSQACVLLCAVGLALLPRRRRRRARCSRCHAGAGHHRTGLRSDHARVVAPAGAHRAAGAHGADVLDQADRRSGRRRARRARLPGFALAFGLARAFVVVAVIGVVIAAVAQPTRAPARRRSQHRRRAVSLARHARAACGWCSARRA